jgi:hypothetical protein
MLDTSARGLQATGERSESRGKNTQDTQARRAPLRRTAQVRLLKRGRGAWMHGLKGREEIAGLTIKGKGNGPCYLSHIRNSFNLM